MGCWTYADKQGCTGETGSMACAWTENDTFVFRENSMQDTIKDIPFRLGHQVAVVGAVLLLLACGVCAQDAQRQRECEAIFAAAVQAEQRNDLIEAELRYEECREFAQRHRLPKMEAAALHRLAVLKAQSRRFSESASFFRRALDIEPRNAVILRDFAQLFADRRDYAEAERLLKRALDADPHSPQTLLNLGFTIINSTQRDERHIEGLRYLKLAVGDAEAYRELARIYRSKGDHYRAEFAERKAQEAAAAGNIAAPIHTPHRIERETFTPPAITNRVRQEIADAEVREAIERQFQQTQQDQLHQAVTPPTIIPSAATSSAATPPVGQKPPIPAPVSPVFSGAAAMPPAFDTVPAVRSLQHAPPQPAAPLFNSFTPLVPSQGPPLQSSAPSPVRSLNLQATATPNQTPSTVRTIPSLPVRTPAIPSSSPVKRLTPIPAANLPSTDSIPTTNNSVATPQPSQNPTPAEPKPIPLPSAAPSPSAAPPTNPPDTDGPRRQQNTPSIRVLPSGTLTTGHTNAVPDNPRQQHPPRGEPILPATAADSAPTSLTPLAATGTVRRLPSLEQGNTPESLEAVPTEEEALPLIRFQGVSVSKSARSSEGVSPPPSNSPHERDVGVLESPTAVITRRGLLRNKNTSPDTLSPENVYYYVANLRSERSNSESNSGMSHSAASSAAMSNAAVPNPATLNGTISNRAIPETVPGNRQFVSAHAPRMLQFAVSNPPPLTHAENPVTVSSVPAEARRDEPQVPASQTPFFAIRAPAAPPVVAETRRTEPQTPAAQTPLPVVPIPEEAQAPLIIAEVRRAEPQVTLSPAPVMAMSTPVETALSAAPPVVAETRRAEPQLPATQTPLPVVPIPEEVQAPLIIAEARKAEPQVTLSPAPVMAMITPVETALPAVPPVVAETRRTEPLILSTRPPLSTTTVPAAPPMVVEVRRAGPQSPVASFPERDHPKPLSASEGPVGFASTRQSAQPVAASEESLPGFARSRR